MKKFLSMVMALAMTLTLVTVGASAKSFTDNSKITYGEAVDVISSLKVVDGYTDGSFNPTATLTRGAAAKIICNMILGPTTASALGVTSAPFTDVPVTNVFAGYIAYCSSQGIINGYGDGTFKPAATVTGYQFMKMLLGALGYDGSIEGFTGTNWTVNVAKLAVSIGLDDGNDSFVGSKAMTREEAALYAFNTLTSSVVTYANKGTTITVNGATISTGATSAETAKWTGTEGKDYTAGTASSAGQTKEFCEVYFPKLVLTSSGVAGDFGRPTNTWYNDSTKIGAYSSKTPVLTLTATTKEKDIFTALGADGLALTSTGTKYVVMDKVYVDGVQTAASMLSSGDYVADGTTYSGSAYNASVQITKGNDTDTVGTSNGAIVEIYKTDTANHYIMVVINQYLAKINSITKADTSTDTGRQINMTVYTPNGTPTSVSKSYETDSFAKGDYVLVTMSAGTVKSAVAVTTVEDAAVTSYGSSSVTAGGTSYKYDANYVSGDKGGYTMSGGATYTLYLDANGYVIMDETYTADNSNYLMVLAVSTLPQGDATVVTPYYNVKYINADGKTVVCKTATAPTAGHWYTIEDDSDNDGYVVFNAVSTTVDATAAYAINGAALTQDSGSNYVLSKTQATVASGIVATGETTFVLKTASDTYKVYTGIANVPGYEQATEVDAYAIVKGGYAKVVYIDVTGATATTTGADDLVYLISGTPSKTAYDATNKVNYYVYDAVVDGVKTTISSSATTLNSSTAGLVKITSYNSNGYVSVVSPVSGDGYNTQASLTAADVTYSNGTLIIGSTAYVVASDAPVYMIDSDNDLTVGTADDLVGTVTGSAYVVYASTTNSTVTAIYFDGSIN